MDADTLMHRARSLVGASVPSTDGGHKGAIGTFVERALGIEPCANDEHITDIPGLGVEVKTIPVVDGRVLESTWVCVANPAALVDETWATSRVRTKLTCVLFVPHDRDRVGVPFIWQPDDDDERTLRTDWEDLADLVAHGLGFAVSARRGRALQLRPKAADASIRVIARGVDGQPYVDAPQGFYLRRSFTQRIVDAALA